MYQTSHQKKLFQYFKSHPTASFSAKSLIEEFKGQINKATIYRKLLCLEEEKLIHKSYNPKSKGYEYQYAKDCDHHFHLLCKHCGKIMHLKCDEVNGFIEHLFLKHSFLIDQGETLLMGLCEECKKYA
ncbi:MAG: transcriptional repressor [Anaeroplasmataceae bacterium]|nr:transcriptional repressor [Anaeroplasmataceae bacterium]